MQVVTEWAQKAPFLKQVDLTGLAAAAVEKARAESLPGIPGRKAYEAALAAKQEPHVLRLVEPVGCNLQIAEVVTLAVDGKPVGVLHIEDKWTGHPKLEAEARFGTQDDADPRVQALVAAGHILFGGAITFI